MCKCRVGQEREPPLFYASRPIVEFLVSCRAGFVIEGDGCAATTSYGDGWRGQHHTSFHVFVSSRFFSAPMAGFSR